MKDRIRKRMDELGMSQGELAELMGVSQPMIAKYLNGAKTKKLLEMADALQCTPEYLQDGRNPPQAVFDKSGTNVTNIRKTNIKGWIPLISYVQAGQWSEAIDLYDPGYAESVVPTTVPHSKHTFALRVDGPSMTLPDGVNGHSFPAGMVIYVDPEKPAQSGDYVVAKHSGNGHVTFKRLLSEEGRPVLVPLNPDRSAFPVIRDEFEIIGRVIDASWGGL
ncbi:LexA family protein [Haliea salexigens]|uniref:LexA family protein n=1 Tax=Haliea salexigens TaxID=287487 RepID=UPI00130E41BB|nr:S24 family peptidase [Haliea salexigens]